MTDNNYRIDFIDVIKGFLLLCICLSHIGHVPIIIEYLVVPTGAIYVPVFFILSGFLFKENRSFVSFLEGKLRSLFVPYIFFFVVFIFLDWNLYKISKTFLVDCLKAFLNAGGPSKAAPIWFMFKLFMVSILYYLITNTFKNNFQRFSLVLILSILGFICYYYSIKLFFGLEVVLSSIFFVGFGHLAKEYIYKLLFYLNNRKWFINLLFLVFFLSVSLVCFINNSDSVLAQNLINNYFLFYIGAISGGCTLIILSNFLTKNFSDKIIFKFVLVFFKYLSFNSLIILGTHCYIILIIHQILKRSDLLNPTYNFLCIIFSVLILTYYFIVPFLHKYFYFIFERNNPQNNRFKFFNDI